MPQQIRRRQQAPYPPPRNAFIGQPNGVAHGSSNKNARDAVELCGIADFQIDRFHGHEGLFLVFQGSMKKYAGDWQIILRDAGIVETAFQASNLLNPRLEKRGWEPECA
jgi:hypothetical protein